MSFLNEMYPEFIKDKKLQDNAIVKVLSDVNKRILMANGITKDSKLKHISIENAKKSKELILYRKKNPKDPVKIWLGYSIDDRFHIWRPSDIDANITSGTTPDFSKENKDKLYGSDDVTLAFIVTRSPKAVAMRKFKRENPSYWETQATQKDIVFRTAENKIKDSIISDIDKYKEQIMKEISSQKHTIVTAKIKEMITQINNKIERYLKTLSASGKEGIISLSKIV